MVTVFSYIAFQKYYSETFRAYLKTALLATVICLLFSWSAIGNYFMLFAGILILIADLWTAVLTMKLFWSKPNERENLKIFFILMVLLYGNISYVIFVL